MSVAPLSRFIGLPARSWLLVVALTVVAGCAALERYPVPPELHYQAEIPGQADVRAWAGVPNEAMQRDFERSFEQESAADFPPGADGLVRYPYLAISGGGANGAFGAGFINGWTSTGRRPVFKVVTGVSTGALMAPFVFLGPDHDTTLREFYTSTRSRDIFIRGSTLRRLLSNESLADTWPLQAIIAGIVDDALLREIAQAHASGRRLYIGTTDLDAQRFVVWNMGLIAASGHEDALALFRNVMLASASVPVAFPPVLFEVEVDDRRYDEMHVDGAVSANIFVTGGVFRPSQARSASRRGPGREDFFIIHNGQVNANPQPTRRTLRAIAARSLDTATRAGMQDELIRVKAYSLRENSGYAWIGIPQGTNLTGTEIFDPVLMGELFELGYRQALSGPEWNSLPPGLREDQSDP